jgi:biopolymer transport protein TolR
MSRRERRRFAHTAEINMTNLIDVALVLLIIFMITAPILQGGVEVRLPQTVTSPVSSTQGVVVTVTKNSAIYIGDVPVASDAEFQTLYPRIVRSKGYREAYLRGDRDVPYGRVLQVLGMMKQLNVVEVGLIAEPVQER